MERMMREDTVNFILPEMKEIAWNNDEMYQHTIMMEHRVQRLKKKQNTTRQKLNDALQESYEKNSRVLQEFDDIVDWTIENGQEKLTQIMAQMSDLLFRERQYRQNVIQTWYHHQDADRAVMQAVEKVQEQYVRRMEQLESNDDYLQERMEKGERFSKEQLEFFWREEEYAQKDYERIQNRLQSSLDYVQMQRQTTYSGMERNLHVLSAAWQAIEKKLEELCGHMKEIYGELGEKESKRLCMIVKEETETLEEISKIWHNHIRLDRQIQEAYQEKIKNDGRDMRWMEEIYATTQAEVHKSSYQKSKR